MTFEPSDITAWLFRMLAGASVLMCIWLWPMVKAEFHTEGVPWYRNKALRLSSALFIHGIGAVLLFASPMFYRADQPLGLAVVLMWAALALWLAAKLLFISVVGRLGLCLGILGAWTVGRVAYEVFVG